MQSAENQNYSGGKYFGKDENGTYHIGVKDQIILDPEKLIAILAHEISHIKLLGEERTAENNEPLTDLTTVFFGLGGINANVALKYTGNLRSYSISQTGYLEQAEWGYALALRSFLIGEENPNWVYYLNATIKSDYHKCLQFFIESEFSLDEYTSAEPPMHPRFKPEAVKPEPSDELSAEYERAFALYQKEQFADCSELFFNVALKEPAYKQAFNYALYTSVKAKNYSKAIELVEHWGDNHPAIETDAQNAAIAYLRLAKYEGAAKYFQICIDGNPFDIIALNNAGFCYNRLERYAEAIPYFDDALEYEPDLAFAYNNRGLAKIKTGQFEDGLRDIKHSLQLNPGNAYSYRNMGVYYLDKGQKAYALENFNKAKELDPTVDDIEQLIAATSY